MHADIERFYVEQGYRLPKGMTSASVAEQRARRGLPERLCVGAGLRRRQFAGRYRKSLGLRRGGMSAAELPREPHPTTRTRQ